MQMLLHLLPLQKYLLYIYNTWQIWLEFTSHLFYIISNAHSGFAVFTLFSLWGDEMWYLRRQRKKIPALQHLQLIWHYIQTKFTSHLHLCKSKISSSADLWSVLRLKLTDQMCIILGLFSSGSLKAQRFVYHYFVDHSFSLITRPSSTPYPNIGRPGISYHVSDVTGRQEVDTT